MSKYMKVDPRHPFVGLNDKVCKNPRHYCCVHNVWLSEEDARKRHCRTRDESGCACEGFLKNHYERNIEKLLYKTRIQTQKGKKGYY